MTDDIPTVNGAALDSLDGVEDAFGYLGKDYNSGNITRNLDGSRVLVTSRRGRFQHIESVLAAHTDGHIRLADLYATGDGRQRLEIAEV